jgi:hypothetical protein
MSGNPHQYVSALVSVKCHPRTRNGWVVQLNGDATFGLCRAAVDMIGLGFYSMGGANHPACSSFIPHQTEGELIYTVTYREMERAVIALFTANLDKECEFTTCLKHLLAQQRVQDYMRIQRYRDGLLAIDQAQCDHQAGWHNFCLNIFEKEPNICWNHMTGKHYQLPTLHETDTHEWSHRHCRCQHIARLIFRRSGPPRQV